LGKTFEGDAIVLEFGGALLAFGEGAILAAVVAACKGATIEDG
jgi:hypothetical protein